MSLTSWWILGEYCLGAPSRGGVAMASEWLVGLVFRDLRAHRAYLCRWSSCLWNEDKSSKWLMVWTFQRYTVTTVINDILSFTCELLLRSCCSYNSSDSIRELLPCYISLCKCITPDVLSSCRRNVFGAFRYENNLSNIKTTSSGISMTLCITTNRHLLIGRESEGCKGHELLWHYIR